MNEYRRGDIVLADLGKTIGSEQGGLRPVLITQNDIGNKHSPTIIVAPITSKVKRPMPTHVSIGCECGLECPSTALFEQIRTSDKSRVVKYIGHKELDEEEEKCILITFGCFDILDRYTKAFVR